MPVREEADSVGNEVDQDRTKLNGCAFINLSMHFIAMAGLPSITPQTGNRRQSPVNICSPSAVEAELFQEI